MRPEPSTDQAKLDAPDRRDDVPGCRGRSLPASDDHDRRPTIARLMVAVAIIAFALSLGPRSAGLYGLAIALTAFGAPVFVAARKNRHVLSAALAASLPSAPLIVATIYSAAAWLRGGTRLLEPPDTMGDFERFAFLTLTYCFLFSLLGWIAGPILGLILDHHRGKKGLPPDTWARARLFLVILTPISMIGTAMILWNLLRLALAD